MTAPIDHGPAMTVRRIDKGYPFGDKYPVLVRTKKHVRSDTFNGMPLSDIMLSSSAGTIWPAWTNSYGAVSAIMPGGNLGLYPDEFEVVQWSVSE